MSQIPAKNATSVQLVTINSENYVKYTALDENKDLRDYFVKVSTKETLLNPEPFASGSIAFNSMKILDLPQNQNNIVVGYFTYTPSDGYKYLQYDISTNKTETFDLKNIPNSQTLKFESWDANGLKENDMMLCFAYTSDKTTYVHEVYGDGVQQISSFPNEDEYPFETLFVGRGLTRNVNKILLPTGSTQKTQTQDPQIALVQGNIVQNPEQIQSLGCFLISSNELSRLPINFNVTSFLPLNQKDSIQSSNFQVTYKGCQASYDANIIVMMIEISFDQIDKDGNVTKKIKNMMVQSSNCGRDYFPSIVNNNMYTDKDIDTTFMDNNLKFKDIDSLVRLQNDMNQYPTLWEKDANALTDSRDLSFQIGVFMSLLKTPYMQSMIPPFFRSVLEQIELENALEFIPYIYFAFRTFIDPLLLLYKTMGNFVFTCKFSNNKYLSLSSTNGASIQNIKSSVSEALISQVNLNKFVTIEKYNGEFLCGTQNQNEAFGVEYTVVEYYVQYFHQNGYQKTFILKSFKLDSDSRERIQPKFITSDREYLFIIGVSNYQYVLFAYPLEREVKNGYVSGVGEPFKDENIVFTLEGINEKSSSLCYYLKGNDSTNYIYIPTDIGFNRISFKANNDVTDFHYRFENLGKNYDTTPLKFYQDTSKNNSDIFILKSEFKKIASYIISSDKPTEASLRDEISVKPLTSLPIRSFFVEKTDDETLKYSVYTSDENLDILFDKKQMFINEYNKYNSKDYDESTSNILKINLYEDERLKVYQIESKIYIPRSQSLIILPGDSELSPYMEHPTIDSVEILTDSIFASFSNIFFLIWDPFENFETTDGVRPILPENIYGYLPFFTSYLKLLLVNFGPSTVKYFINKYDIATSNGGFYQYLEQIAVPSLKDFIGSISQSAVDTISKAFPSRTANLRNTLQVNQEPKALSLERNIPEKEIMDNNLPIYLQNFTIEGDADIRYATIGLIPSESKNNRVLSIEISGKMRNNSIITIDFSNVNYKNKQQIQLEGPPNGILTFCGQVYSVNKKINYVYENLKLSLNVNISNTITKTKANFSLQITINDTGPVPAAIGNREVSIPNENNNPNRIFSISVEDIMKSLLNPSIHDTTDSSVVEKTKSFFNVLYGYTTFYLHEALNLPYPDNYQTIDERNKLTLDEMKFYVIDLSRQYSSEDLSSAYYYAIYNFQNPFNYALFEEYAGMPTKIKSGTSCTHPVNVYPEKDIRGMNIGNKKDVFVLSVDEDNSYVVDILSYLPEKIYPSIPLKNTYGNDVSLIADPYNLNFALVDSDNIDVIVNTSEDCSNFINNFPFDDSSSQYVANPFLESFQSILLPYLDNLILDVDKPDDDWGTSDTNSNLYFFPNTDGSYKIAWKWKSSPPTNFYFYYEDGQRLLSYTTNENKAASWDIENPFTGNSTTILDQSTGLYLGYNYDLMEFVLVTLDVDVPIFYNTNIYWTIQMVKGGMNQILDGNSSSQTLKNNFTNTITTIFVIDETTPTFQISMSFAPNNTLGCFYMNDKMTTILTNKIPISQIFPLPKNTNTTKNNLDIHKILQVGAFLTSNNSRFTFIVEADTFNLVVYNNLTQQTVDKPLYQHTGDPIPDALLTFQEDGNLVYKNGDSVLWDSNTEGKGAYQFVIQDNGQIVIINKKGDVLWTPSDDTSLFESNHAAKNTMRASETKFADINKIININTTLTAYSKQSIQTLDFKNPLFTPLENAFPETENKTKIVVPVTIPGVYTDSTTWHAFISDVPVLFDGLLNESQAKIEIPISNSSYCLSSDDKIATVNLNVDRPILTIDDNQKSLNFEQNYTFQEFNITYPVDRLNQQPNDQNVPKEFYEGSIRNILYLNQSIYSKSRQYRLTCTRGGWTVYWKDLDGKESIIFTGKICQQGNPCDFNVTSISINNDGSIVAYSDIVDDVDYLISPPKGSTYTDVQLSLEDNGSMKVTGKNNGNTQNLFSSPPGPTNLPYTPYALDNFYSNTIFTMIPSKKDGFYYIMIQSTLDYFQYLIGYDPSSDVQSFLYIKINDKNTDIEKQGVLFEFQPTDDGKFQIQANMNIIPLSGLEPFEYKPYLQTYKEVYNNQVSYVNDKSEIPFTITNANGKVVTSITPYTPYQIRSDGSILQYFMTSELRNDGPPDNYSWGEMTIYAYGSTLNQFELTPNFTGNNFVTWEVDSSGRPLGQSIKFQMQSDTIGLSVVDSTIRGIKKDPTNSYFQIATSFFTDFYRIFFLDDKGTELFWYYNEEKNEIGLKEYNENEKEKYAFGFNHNLTQSSTIDMGTLSIWYEPFLLISCYINGNFVKLSIPENGDMSKLELKLVDTQLTSYSYFFTVSEEKITENIKTLFDKSINIFPESLEVDIPWAYQVSSQFNGGFSFSKGTVYGYNEAFSSFFVWQKDNIINYYANAYPGSLPTYNNDSKKFESKYSPFENYNSRLSKGQSLLYCQYLESPNRMYIMIVQNNQNVCIYDYTTFINEQIQLGSFEGCNFAMTQSPLWMATVNKTDVDDDNVRLSMQDDGNLVLYGKDDKVIWATNTQGTPANAMEILNDGSLIVFEENSGKIWWSSTKGKEDGSRIFFPYNKPEECIPICSINGPAQKKEGNGTTLIFQQDGDLVYTTNYSVEKQTDPTEFIFETATNYGSDVNKELINCDNNAWNQNVKQKNAFLQMYDNFYKNNIQLPEGVNKSPDCNVPLYMQIPPKQRDCIYTLYVTYTDENQNLICCNP